MPRLLPRSNADAQRIEDEKKLAAIIVESDEVEDVVGMPLRRSADGHNRERTTRHPDRGQSRRQQGRVGTDPVGALLRKEARGERRR